MPLLPVPPILRPAVLAPALCLLLVAGCASPRTIGAADVPVAAAPEAPAAPLAPPAPAGSEAAHVALEVQPGGPVDAAMAELLAPYTEGLASVREPIGFSEVLLERAGAAGDWLADVTRDRASVLMGEPVDLALANSGGVRADLPQGPLTAEDLMQVMPFDNHLVVYRLSPGELRRLEEFLARRPGSFPLSGGVISGGPGGPQLLVDGEPIRDGREYLLATNSFVADGGQNARIMMTFQRRMDSDSLIRDLLIDYIRELDADGGVVTMPADLPRYRLDDDERGNTQ